jgi:predicted AAA+ superfamily ATPase
MLALTKKGYRPRLIDGSVDLFLKAFGAVEIVGSKWCGKTWTALAHAYSEIHLDDRATRELVEADYSLALVGESPHVIDEWQEVPALWDAVRRAVDDAGARGLYILTGSSEPVKEEVTHSGTGRIARLHMRPMALSESGHSNGSVSLLGLFEGRFEPSRVSTSLYDIATYICRGGWPGALDLDNEIALMIPNQYLDTALSSEVVKRGRNEYLTRRILQSLARHIGKAVTKETLLMDIGQGERPRSGTTITRPTLDKYLDALTDQFLIEEILGWDAPVKSKSRIRTSPIRSFVDPSLPAALLNMSPKRLLEDMQTFGNLFEELVMRDLRVYASIIKDALPTPVHYYRDSDNLEIDAILELRDGRWAAIEIKLSENKVKKGIQNLIRLKNKVAANPAARNPDPSFMAVITGKSEYCRQTPEGVFVVPITELTA